MRLDKYAGPSLRTLSPRRMCTYPTASSLSGRVETLHSVEQPRGPCKHPLVPFECTLASGLCIEIGQIDVQRGSHTGEVSDFEQILDDTDVSWARRDWYYLNRQSEHRVGAFLQPAFPLCVLPLLDLLRRRQRRARGMRLLRRLRPVASSRASERCVRRTRTRAAHAIGARSVSHTHARVHAGRGSEHAHLSAVFLCAAGRPPCPAPCVLVAGEGGSGGSAACWPEAAGPSHEAARDGTGLTAIATPLLNFHLITTDPR